jgi:PAS domain S-box-containing protein
MMRRWSFAQRVGIGLSACILAGLVLLITLVFALTSLVGADDAGTRESSEAVRKVARLREAFADKVLHARTYAQTGEAASLRAREVARGTFVATVEQLAHADLPLDAQARLADLREAEALHEARHQEMNLRRATTPDAELQWWAQQNVGPARVKVEHQLTALAEALQAGLVERLRQSQERARGALRLILVTALLGLLGVGAVAFLLRRSLQPLYRRYLQSEKRLRLLMEGVQDYALCFLDREGRVSGWSAGAERVTGWSRSEAEGQGAGLLYPQEALAEGLPQAHRERAEREGRLLAEGWRVRRDGSRFWAEMLLTALRDERGQLQGFAEVTRDITERRRAERMQALFAEAGRVLGSSTEREVLAHALVTLCVPAVADACVLLLPGEDGLVRAHALAHPEPEGGRLLWDVLGRPQPGGHGPARVVETGRAELLPELDAERLPRELREGAYGELARALHVRSCLTVPLLVGPRVLGALCLLSTQPHRRYGAVDQALLEELAARAALALDNAWLLSQAQGALEFIGVAAHDLGNPLQSLQLRLRRLRTLADGQEPRVRDGLALAEHETRRLGQMVRNLLDLSRLSTGRRTLETEELDLAGLVREVVERHAEQAQLTGCALSLHAEGPVPGRWDRLRLERVITNLLTNALKFGPGQPVEVRVETTATLARLVVRDRGIGIAPEAQQRIFGRFERVHGGRAQAGFGLGLYIVRQLVEAHGGSIRVRSELGQGAEFTVELPLEPLPAPQATAEIRA